VAFSGTNALAYSAWASVTIKSIIFDDPKDTLLKILAGSKITSKKEREGERERERMGKRMRYAEKDIGRQKDKYISRAGETHRK
jgi:hypothetical protein